MELHRKIEVFGDSILKGIQINPQTMRYHVDNHIDILELEKNHSLSIQNFSRFGCTVTKGFSLIEKHLKKNELFCDAIVMDFGGNDCDFKWSEIACSPNDEHLPNTPLDLFIATYTNLIHLLKEKGIRPILTTLPPISAQRFFDWSCRSLDKANVLKWLGNIETIYHWQEHYSKCVEKIATSTNTLLVDVRSEFLEHKNIKHFLCEDGIHPNTEGQKAITRAFSNFIEQYKSKGMILA